MYTEEELRAMEVEPDALLKRLNGASSGEFELVDVRERMELDRGVLPGAKNIPMSELDLRTAELPREREIIFYCEHGIRSLNACAYFHSMGYKAFSMSGGFASWGGPVEPAPRQN
jgi:rhodanese-related sulfurtransferase